MLNDNKNRIYSLDAIKFFCAVFILFHHFHQNFGQGTAKYCFYGSVIHWGSMVEFFFLISGLFMGLSMEKNREKPFLTFMKEKLIRLMPMVWISVLSFSALELIYRYFLGTWWGDIAPNPWNIIKTCLLIFAGGAFRGDEVMPNNPTWYLCVLLICYVWYWLILRVSKRKGFDPVYLFVFMIVLGISVISYNIQLPFLNTGSGRGYHSFFFGAVLGCLYQKKAIKPNSKPLKWISLTIILLIVLGCCIHPRFFLTNGQGYLLTYFLYPAIIYVFLYVPPINWVFNRKLFGTLGKVSFEMYLWHSVFYLMIALLDGVGLIRFRSTGASMLITAAVIIIWSFLAYYLLEKPITEKLRHRL